MRLTGVLINWQLIELRSEPGSFDSKIVPATHDVTSQPLTARVGEGAVVPHESSGKAGDRPAPLVPRGRGPEFRSEHFNLKGSLRPHTCLGSAGRVVMREAEARAPEERSRCPGMPGGSTVMVLSR